ncbi:hypothetical protein [Trinickia soli]|uniref:hypothetical protein n=1 Tax=Trinickia soli TaxID=380675 RepID=UPI003FA3C777
MTFPIGDAPSQVPASTAPTAPHPSAPASPAPPIELQPGQKLRAGESIRSADGRYELRMQADGNLVEYDLTTHVTAWSTNTAKSGATVAIMQKDGNFVLYKTDPDTLCVNGKNDVWSSGTNGHSGAYLTVEANGDVVVDSTNGSKSRALWQSGLPLPEIPPAQPPLPQVPLALPSSDPRSSGAVGVFKPGQGETGIAQFILGPGDSPYDTLQRSQAAGSLGFADTTSFLDASFAATSALDPKAFGTRAANPADAARTLPIGQTITALNSKRLGYLEQERTQLQSLESAPANATKTQLDELKSNLIGTIYQELDYAATPQAVPDLQQLTASIKARAPQDKAFNDAIDDAASLYQTRKLAPNGRTSNELGKIMSAAAAGNWGQVRALVSDQAVACAGTDQGATALGDITARASVYLTYAGGDPAFATAMRNGIQDAQRKVLVDAPVQTVIDAYHKHGAVAMMQALNKVTDSQTATMGQVGQIMSDSRVQDVIKQAIGDMSDWKGEDNFLNSNEAMLDLSQACQHALESDHGKSGPGRAAVDRIATYIVGQANRLQPANVPFTQLVFDEAQNQGNAALALARVSSAAAGQGNVALAFAVGTQARLYQNPVYASATIDGVRQGLDILSSQVKTLDDQANKDSAFVSVPMADWGANSSPEQQAALVKTLLADNPDNAKTYGTDLNKIAPLKEKVEGVNAAVSAYSGSLKGVVGFDTDVPQPGRGGLYRWGFANTPSVTKALAGMAEPMANLSKKAGFADDASSDPTNTLWLQRSVRKVYEQIGKKLIGDLGADGDKSVMSPKGVKLAQGWWKRINKSVGAVLYFQNAAYTLGEATQDGLLTFMQDGASGIRQELGGISYALSAGIPSDKLASLRPGSGETLLAKSYESAKVDIDALKIPEGARKALSLSIHFAMQDTSDFASAILGATEAAQEFSDGKTWEGVGNVLNTAGYATFLTGSGIDAAEVPIGSALFSESALAALDWVGGGLVAAGALIGTSAKAYATSHEHDENDKQLLEAMGVHPDIATQLAKHATSFDGKPPTAGGFLTQDYFTPENVKVTGGDTEQAAMVRWLNTLTPHQADAMASALKAGDGVWQKEPAAKANDQFNNALMEYGVALPDGIVLPMQLS